MDILIDWFENNYFKLNRGKCELIAPKQGEDVSIRIGNEDIIGKNSVKLLGITLDNELNFNKASRKNRTLYGW